MLHPLIVEQKQPSEDDSSDSGSELGLEPETDRFGFFLTDGSTDGDRRAGPSPAFVRQREAKWINIIDQWDQLLHKKANKVKMQCQKGIPASLRAKCWSLLSGATDRMKQQTDVYKTLDSQPALKHWKDVIERDLDRQFPFHEMFVSKDGHGQRSLFQVLKAYTQFKPEDGYCQAQGPVAAVLLMNMPAEEAFWCLVQICELYLPGYYSPLLEGVLFDAALLTWVLKRSCPAVHKHLQRHGVEPLMFATDWLMCLFTRHLPFNTLLRVWDLFFCYGVRVLLQVTVVMVQRVLGREDQRKRCCGQMETLQTLRDIKTEVKDEEEDFIIEVLSVPLSARDLQRQTEKELQRWQKERPSSTFDPRGRCLGFHMACVRARQSNEECERKEREKGNLSTPLTRSASTLSLSKWQRGVKANSGERKSNVNIMRHRSMGAKEDCPNWANLRDKKMGLRDDGGFFLEKKKQSDPRKLKQENQQSELLEESEQQETEEQDVPQITVNLHKEQLKETKSSGDTSKQEENSESQLTPVENDFTAIKQRETELSPITTDTHIQPSVELIREKDPYQVKSLKRLATLAARCSDLNTEDDKKHLKNPLETQEHNDATDKYQGEKSCSGGCHSTGIETEESHAQSDLELCELAAQEQIQEANTSSTEQVSVGAIQVQTHLPNTDEKICTQCLNNDIQDTSQYVSIEEMLVSMATMAGQTAVQNSTKTFHQTEYTTNSQEKQENLTVPPEGNLYTEDASIDNKKQGDPERETQSNVSQMKKNCSTLEQIGYDFTNSNQQYSFRSSGDFRVRKSSSSRGSRLARRLSEDLFTTPQLLDQRVKQYSSQVENDETTDISNSCKTEETATQKETPMEQQPRRFALFRRLREEKKNKKQSKPKLLVPKIMIQDFSDDREMGKDADVDSKMTSREKRRQRKEQKRKAREDERQRKKEKEIEKEGKRGQGKGTSVQSANIKQQLGSAASQSKHETSYAGVYF